MLQLTEAEVQQSGRFSYCLWEGTLFGRNPIQRTPPYSSQAVLWHSKAWDSAIPIVQEVKLQTQQIQIQQVGKCDFFFVSVCYMTDMVGLCQLTSLMGHSQCLRPAFSCSTETWLHERWMGQNGFYCQNSGFQIETDHDTICPFCFWTYIDYIQAIHMLYLGLDQIETEINRNVLCAC